MSTDYLNIIPLTILHIDYNYSVNRFQVNYKRFKIIILHKNQSTENISLLRI